MSNEKSFAGIFFGGALKSNPVLIHCVALCPVIIASSNLGDSFFIALALTADLLISSFIASAMLKKVPRFIRVAIYLLIGLAIICPVLWIIENKTLINLPLGMRVFLPLIAVNSATALHCETYAVKNSLSSSIKAALASALGISLVLVICGALREIIGKGSLLGNEFHFAFTLPGLSMPFGCLIILGFLAALLKGVFSGERTKRKPAPSNDQPEETELDLGDFDPEAFDLFPQADDDYDYLLSSVNELIDSFTSDSDGGDGE